MNDELLNSLREPPPPAFAAALRQRLAAQERQRRQRALIARAIQFGGVCTAAVCLLLALNLGLLLRRTARQELAFSSRTAFAGSELIPVSQIALLGNTSAARVTQVNILLKVSATAIPHHHQ